MPIQVNLENSNKFNSIRNEVGSELATFLAERGEKLAAISPELYSVSNALKDFLLSGGKRFRPIFAYIGYLGAGGDESKNALTACASLELLQACALIHDDLIDGSDTRRNKPAIHKQFETMHASNNLAGSATQFGLASALLIGDLALIWSDLMLNSANLDNSVYRKVLAIHDEMRIELMAGQYLDVYEQTQSETSVERSLKIARFKSAKYSIERPLHFGAALAGQSDPFQTSYSAYGLPLGEAFQMRDDLLGVFGNEDETGKPIGGDLREGKRTVLIGLTYRGANNEQKDALKQLFGKSDISNSEVAELRQIIIDTGAASEVENMIESLTGKAISSLTNSAISAMGQSFLIDLAKMATQRIK